MFEFVKFMVGLNSCALREYQYEQGCIFIMLRKQSKQHVVPEIVYPVVSPNGPRCND